MSHWYQHRQAMHSVQAEVFEAHGKVSLAQSRAINHHIGQTENSRDD